MKIVSKKFIDFHCHLDLYPDLAAAVRECDGAGIFTLAVTTTPLAWPRNNQLALNSKHVHAALGLHPQLVSERAEEIAIWDQYLPDARFIGEIGLDAGPRYYKHFELQKKVFAHILRASARAGGRILSIHSVRTVRIVLDMLETYFPGDRGKAVFHWFGGTVVEARRAAAMGCYFSINREMLRNEKHRAMVCSLPLDRLLTETDGPFVQIEGRPVRPSDVASTVSELAKALGLDSDQLQEKLSHNLEVLLDS